MAQAEMDAVPSLEVKHAHARLELREKQLQELAGTMSELSTEEVSESLSFPFLASFPFRFDRLTC